MSKDNYNHKTIEAKWQERWRETKIYNADLKKTENRFYNLMMFPYPSAEGLHAGNMFAFTGSDVYGRFQRLQSRNVFEPIGLDGFGIHSENYALKVGRTPKENSEITEKNYYRQLHMIGNGFDWDHTVETYNPNYYRWTQWLFVQLFKAGLAYKKKTFVNWCPGCKTVLSDEQIMTPAQAGKLPPGYSSIDEVPEGTRVCERCGSIPERKELSQWLFRITDYADRLLDNLSKLDWTEKVKSIQKEWIGRSEGAEITFKVKDIDEKLNVFTTRPDTLSGVTFIVMSPETAQKYINLVPENNKREVEEYLQKYLNISEQVRKQTVKEKSGVDMGIYAINPANGEEIKIFVANYVLTNVGTGIVMGVPYHDERDREFAEKYDIEIREMEADNFWWTKMEKEGWGERAKKYHLRDWLISRQRYWGPPIPMIYCSKCAEKSNGWLKDNNPSLRVDQSDWDHLGWYPEENLPIELPDIADFVPEGDGKGPLANHPEFYKTKCPSCGEEAERETDVSDTFVDSSWYFLRYPSVDSETASSLPFDPVVTKNWLPVDQYFGGAEHSVLHLMYSRFVTQVLHDLDYLSFEEPFPKFFAHGLLIKDGAKMSKSKGNVINPDDYIEKFGADTLRLYLMFIGPMDSTMDFRDSGIEGMNRFVNRIWNMFADISKEDKEDASLTTKMHQTIKKVTHHLATFGYNTAISSMMEYVNALREKENYSKMYLKPLIQMIAPFAPYMAEEIWSNMGEEYSVHKSIWPKYDEGKTQVEEVTIPIQINGKVRGQINVSKDLIDNKEEILSLAKKQDSVSKWLEEKELASQIYVPGKIVNLVTK